MAWRGPAARAGLRWRGFAADAGSGSDDEFDAHSAKADFEAQVRSELWMERQLGQDVAELPPNPYTSRVQYSGEFATHRALPVEHTEEDVGKYYTIEDLAAAFPDGVPSGVRDEFDTTGLDALMIRKEALELIQKMQEFVEADGKGPQLPRFKLINGPRGIGKSSMLTHIVHYARTAGWVTLFLPSCWNIMQDGFVLTKSPYRKGMVDQHDIATGILRNMLALHGEQLATAPQTGREYHNDWFLPADLDAEAMAEAKELREAALEEERQLRAEAEARGEDFDRSTLTKREPQVTANLTRSRFNLRDMVEWGLRHPPMATDTLLALKWELQRTRRFPVLIAMDGINHFYEGSVYPMDGKIVPPEQLSIPAAFRSLDKEGFKISHKFEDATKVTGKMKMDVPRLNREEVHAALLHYAHCGRFFLVHSPEAVDANEVEYFRMMSDSNPAELKDVAMFH